MQTNGSFPDVFRVCLWQFQGFAEVVLANERCILPWHLDAWPAAAQDGAGILI